MIKLLSLFSGIGAFEKALDRLEVPYELVNYCEIDKYASKSYSMIHECDESLNLGDITKIDTSKLPNDIDLITYGFPCQDISVAGNLKGFEHEGKRTRSGLFFEALRIIENAQPKFTIAENVKNLTGKRFKKEFEIVLTSLEQAGYNNYWQVLNGKDYGIPQNRERVFIVSIRKDIDNGMFKFPKPLELKLRLKDMLEDEVDEKFYLSDEYMDRFLKSNLEMKGDIHILGTTVGEGKGTNSRHWVHDTEGIVGTLSATDYKQPKQILEPKIQRIGNIYGNQFGTGYAGNVWDKEGLSPSLMTAQGGGRQPMIMVKEATKKGYAAAAAGDSINLEQPNSKTRRGRVGKQVAQTLTTSCNQSVVVYDDYNSRIRKDQDSIGTINTNIGNSSSRTGYKLIENNLRIRKLTPKECWRLMGFDDEDFYKVKGVSNTQLYKQAGNSIVVDVLVYLFKELKECFPDHFGEVVWEDDL